MSTTQNSPQINVFDKALENPSKFYINLHKSLRVLYTQTFLIHIYTSETYQINTIGECSNVERSQVVKTYNLACSIYTFLIKDELETHHNNPPGNIQKPRWYYQY